ncbi:uncharacterized protein B0T23DRAFT_354994 [Neurospora hispaniola]|uniref:Uncharacterized protein n=1 Tax=Neurospora hispaniola TaxID=588809 RepID=A0AAJ0I9B7_9PEZI|nr:hypothetical protein B0T23DRAFT_354994 [Neurospora hispaniola]
MNWTPHPPLPRRREERIKVEENVDNELKLFAMRSVRYSSTSSDRYFLSTSGNGAYKSLLLWV